MKSVLFDMEHSTAFDGVMAGFLQKSREEKAAKAAALAEEVRVKAEEAAKVEAEERAQRLALAEAAAQASQLHNVMRTTSLPRSGIQCYSHCFRIHSESK